LGVSEGLGEEKKEKESKSGELLSFVGIEGTNE
jgi:hypothetical protein